MTASIFSRSFGRAGSEITLVESPNVPTIGVGEGTTPLFKRFLKFLEVPEEEFMTAARATYKHGISFPGWTGSTEFDAYFHPFAAPGYNEYEQAFFAQCDARRRGEPGRTDPSDYFFNAELARQCKAPVGPPPCDPGRFDYAYHFDTAFLANFLKQRCLDEGVRYVVDDVTSVIHAENGDLGHVVTASSGDLHADLFVDCTGFRRLLLGEVLETDPVSYEPRLFNNRAVVIRTPVPGTGDLAPYTESTALRNGWAWRIPLMNKVSWGYVYSANYTSQEAAEAELRQHIGAESEGIEPLNIRLNTGRVHEHWKRNCLAVGLSQGFIEPLEATALGLTQFTINRFVTHFARGGFGPAHRDHFNEIINEAFDVTIDYIQMHYKLTTRSDTAYWRDCRDNDNVSDTMRAVIAAWEDPAADFTAALKDHVHRSSYAPYSWYCILSGMGRYPDASRVAGERESANPYEDEVGRFFSHRRYLESLQPADEAERIPA